MSWSNVMDYVCPLDRFHALARACSAKGDTMHFGYSMNWPTEVHGTCLIDQLPGPASILVDFMEDPPNYVHTQRDPRFGRGMFEWPTFDNPIAVTTYTLCFAFHNDWADYFVRKAKCLDSYARPYLVPGKNDALAVRYSRVGGAYAPMVRSSQPPLEFAWGYDSRFGKN
eukprot:TRINITY_DN7582_c0_g2_i1.p1 TRINITY_DN7582_c0_g2~~TRINITY_DN7582_c0_g2_i1.p1  ORF type:complete len:169 (+),score=52.65 TRINITY_DN7582_c0_g2_i1:60-566(+)